jgi:lysophospholipase L1-like esterase
MASEARPSGDAPDDFRDPRTPAEVIVNREAREPMFDPTAGVPVEGVDRRGQPKNRLVVLGDSLTQGFQSGAIFNTRLSWPMIVAWEMGCDEEFRFPVYDAQGGLPLNIEFLIRALEHKFGDKIDFWEAPFALFEVRSLMAKVEAYWESAASIPKRTSTPMHNLAVYGWDVRDLLDRNWKNLRGAIEKPKNDTFNQFVQNHNERAALRVYGSLLDEESVLAGARRLGDEGCTGVPPEASSGHGIEVLIVFIGANNALGSVTSLNVKWSGPGYDTLAGKGAYNVWRPSHFQAELDQLTREVKRIKARHVILATIPHVTIAPIARGVAGKVREGSRYFPYYTRPWIDDAHFDPKDDPKITENQARAIDSAIDQYNDAITRAVREARREGRDWYVIDIAGVLDRLAARRYLLDESARPSWWKPYEFPPALAALEPKPDSRFFGSGPRGRSQGGLFSLDGVHPTTVGYGIIAQEMIDVMRRAGVKFYQGDYRDRASHGNPTERTGPIRVDFERLIQQDTLIAKPPRSLTGNLDVIGWFDQTLDLFGRLNPFS